MQARKEEHSGITGRYTVPSETQETPSSILKKYMILPIQNRQLMLYGEIMTVCPQIHIKHINALCGQNVELLNIKLAVHIVTTGL